MSITLVEHCYLWANGVARIRTTSRRVRPQPRPDRPPALSLVDWWTLPEVEQSPGIRRFTVEVYDKIRRVTQPSSDDWLSRGFRSGERRCVVRSLVYYRVWTDHDDQPVGVTVDYEYAEDVHFDLEFASWMVFLEAAGIPWTIDSNPKRLKDALFRDGYSEFEKSLVQLDLPYRRLVYR